MTYEQALIANATTGEEAAPLFQRISDEECLRLAHKAKVDPEFRAIVLAASMCDTFILNAARNA